MTIFTNFTQSFQTDPIFRKKSIFAGVASLTVILLLIGFIWLNFSGSIFSQKKAETKVTKPAETKEVFKSKATVTATSFDNNPNFKKISKESLAFPDSLAVVNDQGYFINDKFYFTGNEKPVVTNTLYTASSLFTSPDGIIINEDTGPSIYTKEQQIKGFPAKTEQVIPVSKGKSTIYNFIDLNTKPISVASATKSDLSDKTLLADISFAKEKIYQKLELRELGKKIYLFGFENTNRLGKVDIYLVDSNKTTFQQEIKDIVSFKYAKNQIIYNTYVVDSGNPTPKINVIDFNTSKLETFSVDILNKLSSDRVYGGFLANRCSIGENSDTMYCLIKENPKPENIESEADVLAKIEWKVNKVSYLLKNDSFSASSIYAINDKNIYLVSQIGNYLYKINNVDSQ
jgi:hypothetical protein